MVCLPSFVFPHFQAATIVSELQVVHPAAKMVQLAAEQQQQEYGDAMNLTMVFCGELLSQAESLIRMGLHPADIIRGFEKAGEKVTEYLNSLVVETVKEDQELIQVREYNPCRFTHARQQLKER